MSGKSPYGGLFGGTVKVRNVDGTTDDKPPSGYDSWKEWWEDKRHKRFEQCSNTNCSNNAEVGAHVEKVSYDNKSYIVPLCRQCNSISSNDSFYVRKDDLEPIADGA